MHKMILSSVAAVAFAVAALAYSGKASAQAKSNSGAQQNSTDNARAADPQRTFALLKTLAGTWQASITTPDQPQTPREEGNGVTTQVTLRVTSRGNAILHEVHDPKVPDDPTQYDHPISVIYLDKNQLNLTHYCDSGNRPHMRARNSLWPTSHGPDWNNANRVRALRIPCFGICGAFHHSFPDNLSP